MEEYNITICEYTDSMYASCSIPFPMPSSLLLSSVNAPLGPHLITHLGDPLSHRYILSDSKTMAISWCVAAGESLKNSRSRDSAITNNWTKSQDIATLLKRHKRPASRA